MSVFYVTWQINKQTFGFTEGLLSEKSESSDTCLSVILQNILFLPHDDAIKLPIYNKNPKMTSVLFPVSPTIKSNNTTVIINLIITKNRNKEAGVK